MEQTMKNWTIQEKNFDPSLYGRYETLFALSNGFIGVRGSFEDAPVTGGHDGFYLNGFYETYPLKYGETFPGYPAFSQAMVNLPNPKKLNLLIDGDLLSLEDSPPLSYERTLHLHTALLNRKVRVRSRNNKEFLIESERFVSADNKNLFCLRYSIRADESCRVTLSSGYDLESRNLSKKEDPRVGVEFTDDPVHKLKTAREENRITLCGSIRHSGLNFCSYMAHKVSGGTDLSREILEDESFFGEEWQFSLKEGESFTLEKYVWIDRDRELPPPEETDALISRDYKDLKKEHTDWWKKAWKTMDVTITGDDSLQQGIRFNMFHLLQSAGKDGKTNISAKGMTGEGYEGHYFWDTEIYMIPFFTFTNPPIARSLLSYRHSILGAARSRARDMGHKEGALFPWRTISGPECSSYFPAGTAQYHLSSDIAHALKIYWEGTGDTDFLLTKGMDLLVETNRLWADMAVFDKRAGGYAIQNVTGPDEYTALVDNNFYTNRMVMDQLQFFGNLRKRFGAMPGSSAQKSLFLESLKRLKVREEEMEKWEDIGERMYLPYDEELKITPQDDRFLQKPLWDIDKTPSDHFPLLMHYHPLVLYRYQVCKQPDVVLAEFLLSRKFSREQKERDYDYYEKITTHDSSLSPCIYGCMASDIGRIEESYNFYVKTARTDLDDFHGNVKDGVHAANMAGSWIGLVYGFARMRHGGGVLGFAPLLPGAWESYAFRIHWGGSVLSVTVSGDSTAYELVQGESMKFEHYGQACRLDSENLLMEMGKK